MHCRRLTMRERHDACGKESLEVLLEDVGTVTRGLEVSGSSQRFDLWFAPEPSQHAERMRRGLLGELVDDPAGCALELFRNTPGERALDECVRRLALRRHALVRAAKGRVAPRPWVVVISPGVPEGSLVEFGFTEDVLRRGVYRSARGMGLVLVVVSRLPETRETLALRTLGRGATWERAMRELASLPADTWERRLVEVLLRWRGEIEALRAREARENAEVPTDMGTLWEQIRTELTRDAVALGRAEVLARQFERRLRRSLTTTERDTLRERLATLGDERLSDLVLEHDGPWLASWLAAPDGR